MAIDVKGLISAAIKFHQSGDFSSAQMMYSEALKIEPENANAFNLLGLLKIETKDFLAAVNYLKKAVSLMPCAYYYESLGRAYFCLEDYENAIFSFRHALEFESDSFDALFNLALTFKSIKDYENAINTYEQALLLKPDSAESYFNLGNIYEKQNNTKKALWYYEKAHEYKINYEWIDYFLGTSYLKIKDFKSGWQHFEGRPAKVFSVKSQELVYKEKITQTPIWQGEDISDKTLFVYYDSALGDTLMFARYLSLLKDKCKKLLFKPQSCFIDLFNENNFGAEIIDNKTLPKDVNFDVHIPLVSVPYALSNFSEDDIPLPGGYLKANRSLVSNFKAKYFNNDKFKIGIKWMGCPNYDRERILPIGMFNQLFDIENTQFYSLQKGEGIEEFEKIPEKYNVVDLSGAFKTFTETAAAIANLDLVICNDTSVAHLAGAMEKKCFILLPFVPNWRWFLDYSYCPWYNSATLFKQTSVDIWDDVFDDVKRELIKCKINKTGN